MGHPLSFTPLAMSTRKNMECPRSRCSCETWECRVPTIHSSHDSAVPMSRKPGETWGTRFHSLRSQCLHAKTWSAPGLAVVARPGNVGCRRSIVPMIPQFPCLANPARHGAPAFIHSARNVYTQKHGVPQVSL